MTVDELIEELQTISYSGKGDYKIYVYDDCGDSREADYLSLLSKERVFIE